MSLSNQLTAMLFELRSATSPIARARALARAWRTLRQLSPKDRMILAEEAGFEGAEELIETLATKKSGVAPAMMLQLFNRIRDRGPDGVGEILAGLRDPQRRQAMLVHGVDVFVRELEGGDDEESPEPESVGEADGVVPEPEPDAETGEDGEEPKPEPVAAARETEPLSGAKPGAAAATAALASPIQSALEDDEPREPEIGPEENLPEPEAAAETRERDSVSERVGDIDRESDGERFEEPETRNQLQDQAPGDLGGLVDELAVEVSPAAKLRLLRAWVRSATGANPASLGRVLKAFAPGWARRRALVALLEAGIPAEPNVALDLIAGLKSSSDRRWCIGVLADTVDLRGRPARRALELVDSPALRRRLERCGQIEAIGPR